MKIENSQDPTQSVETDTNTTIAGEWETMEFDFLNESEGTAALNTDFVFDMASIFFDFGSSGNQNMVYYFDNVSFGFSFRGQITWSNGEAVVAELDVDELRVSART